MVDMDPLSARERFRAAWTEEARNDLLLKQNGRSWLLSTSTPPPASVVRVIKTIASLGLIDTPLTTRSRVTLLAFAVQMGFVSLVQCLLENGADPNHLVTAHVVCSDGFPGFRRAKTCIECEVSILEMVVYSTRDLARFKDWLLFPTNTEETFLAEKVYMYPDSVFPGTWLIDVGDWGCVRNPELTSNPIGPVKGFLLSAASLLLKFGGICRPNVRHDPRLRSIPEIAIAFWPFSLARAIIASGLQKSGESAMTTFEMCDGWVIGWLLAIWSAWEETKSKKPGMALMMIATPYWEIHGVIEKILYIHVHGFDFNQLVSSNGTMILGRAYSIYRKSCERMRANAFDWLSTNCSREALYLINALVQCGCSPFVVDTSFTRGINWMTGEYSDDGQRLQNELMKCFVLAHAWTPATHHLFHHPALKKTIQCLMTLWTVDDRFHLIPPEIIHMIIQWCVCLFRPEEQPPGQTLAPLDTVALFGGGSANVAALFGDGMGC